MPASFFCVTPMRVRISRIEPSRGSTGGRRARFFIKVCTEGRAGTGEDKASKGGWRGRRAACPATAPGSRARSYNRPSQLAGRPAGRLAGWFMLVDSGIVRPCTLRRCLQARRIACHCQRATVFRDGRRVQRQGNCSPLPGQASRARLLASGRGSRSGHNSSPAALAHVLPHTPTAAGERARPLGYGQVRGKSCSRWAPRTFFQECGPCRRQSYRMTAGCGPRQPAGGLRAPARHHDRLGTRRRSPALDRSGA